MQNSRIKGLNEGVGQRVVEQRAVGQRAVGQRVAEQKTVEQRDRYKAVGLSIKYDKV